ncbi:MAG: potassium-transporting ATPase subunit KdpA [Lysobacterales bacterium]
MIAIGLVLVCALLAAWLLGRYLQAVFVSETPPLLRLLGPVETAILRLIGLRAAPGMDWRGYAMAFVKSNLMLGLLCFAVLLLQQRLPLNPDGAGGLSWDLALHTMVSFLTNTNQQHYSGQAQLSYLSQLVALVTLQVLTPMMGFAVMLAVLRGMKGGRNPAAADGEPRDLGNFYADTLRATLHVLLPLWLILSLALGGSGVPSTLEGAARATPIDQSAGVSEQIIPRGPMATMVAVKQLGTNGGGWYGPNSAAPLENPSASSNALQLAAIVLIPLACVFLAGPLLGRPRFTPFALGSLGLVSLLFIVLAVYSELQPNAAAIGLADPGPNLEGKEVRFGPEWSALWSTLTTQTSNGSVNAMHDSLNPIAGLVALSGMLINAVWGGIGCGLVGFLVYVWLTAFLAGLMVGRTPEVYGRKLEVREMRWIGVLVIAQPLSVLAATALSLSIPGLAGNSNPGLHGVAQVFYEYTSAYANNGSGFEGLGDATPWWNLSCVVLLLIGRYLHLIVPLAIAGSLASKRPLARSSGSLPIDTPTFAIALIAVMVLLTLLSFLPALVLGPLGEALSIPTWSTP